MHSCNPWCFGGVHALLFDSELSDRAALEGIAQTLAAQAGCRYIGVTQVLAQGVPAPGTITAEGVARGRMVVWAAPA